MQYHRIHIRTPHDARYIKDTLQIMGKEVNELRCGCRWPGGIILEADPAAIDTAEKICKGNNITYKIEM